jgi:HlyD family secretion protein
VKNKKKIIIISTVILLVVFAHFWKSRQPKVASAPPTVKVERMDLSNKITVLGTIETASKQEVYPEITGIVKYAVEEGVEVKKGDILLELDQRDLLSDVQQIQSKLSQQKAELTRLLQGPRPEELEKAKLRFSDATTALNRAEKLYKENRELFELGAISQKELDGFKGELDQANTQLAVAKLDLDLLENSDETEVEIKKILLQDTQDRLILAQDKIQKTFVKAELDGLVLKSILKPGMLTSPGSDVITVGDPLDLQITFGVNEYDSAKLAMGQRGMVTGEGFFEEAYEGEIVKIAPMATQTQTSRGNETSVKATLKILNADHKIKPGFSATVEVTAEEKKGVLVLPLESVIEENGTKKVLVMENNNTVEQTIKTGLRNELYVEVLEGLIEGEEVLRYPSQNPADKR